MTDLDEVRRLGTAKAEENLAFRRYLSAHHADDKRFQILANKVQQHVDCTACANCCRYSVVSVDPSEIDAIARYVGVTPVAATRLYTIADPDAPALRTLRSTDEGCVFLKDNRCQIYSARPSSLARWATLCPILYNALESYKHLTGYHPAHKPAA